MTPSRQSFVGVFAILSLFFSSLAHASRAPSATVTCTDVYVEAFTNPSFETGLTGWTSAKADGQTSTGVVVEGDAADGSYF
jgi:hypothetical protein